MPENCSGSVDKHAYRLSYPYGFIVSNSTYKIILVFEFHGVVDVMYVCQFCFLTYANSHLLGRTTIVHLELNEPYVSKLAGTKKHQVHLPTNLVN